MNAEFSGWIAGDYIEQFDERLGGEARLLELVLPALAHLREALLPAVAVPRSIGLGHAHLPHDVLRKLAVAAALLVPLAVLARAVCLKLTLQPHVPVIHPVQCTHESVGSPY